MIETVYFLLLVALCLILCFVVVLLLGRLAVKDGQYQAALTEKFHEGKAVKESEMARDLRSGGGVGGIVLNGQHFNVVSSSQFAEFRKFQAAKVQQGVIDFRRINDER